MALAPHGVSACWLHKQHHMLRMPTYRAIDYTWVTAVSAASKMMVRHVCQVLISRDVSRPVHGMPIADGAHQQRKQALQQRKCALTASCIW